MGNNPGEDALFWLQPKGGDREALAAIYRRHSISLIAYGLRLCPTKIWITK